MEPMSRSGGLYHNVATLCVYLRVGTDFSLARSTGKRKFTYVDHEVIVAKVVMLVDKDRVSGTYSTSSYFHWML